MSECTIPTENNLIITAGREPHDKAYIYVQHSVCNQ
jgi:hypothetical protein